MDGPETFQVVLTNASAGTQIGDPGAAVITIVGDITGFQLATNAYTTGENGGSVVVTVNRLNVTRGPHRSISPPTTARRRRGLITVATNGVLNFADGQGGSTNVTITILNPDVVEDSKSFSFVLSNPVSAISTNCDLLSPSNALVTITNTVTSISFSSATYSVSELAAQAQINVVLSGENNTFTSVQCATVAGGTGDAGVNYFPTNVTLTFAPGVTSQTFAVNIINDHVITNDHTVVLNLSAPQGGAVLGSPSTAVLDIVEGNGSYIIAAGTQLISGGSSGVINPGATVTMEVCLAVHCRRQHHQPRSHNRNQQLYQQCGPQFPKLQQFGAGRPCCFQAVHLHRPRHQQPARQRGLPTSGRPARSANRRVFISSRAPAPPPSPVPV